MTVRAEPPRPRSEPAARAPRRYRLAIVASHPVQYQVPLYRALAACEQIDLSVLFCAGFGAHEYHDHEFGRTVRWDRPALEGYRHVFLRNVSPRPRPGTLLGLVNPGLPWALARGRFDAVIVPGYAVASYWLAVLGAWLSGTPLFFRGETVLRPDRPWPVRVLKGALLRALFRGTAACLTIGSRSREFYAHYGVAPERLFFTPYTVDNDFFVAEGARLRQRRAELRAELGLPPERPVVLFVGKLVERKRPFDLLEAWAALSGAAALVFVGEGALRPALEARARELGLRNVVFAGFHNQSELPRFYALADVLALPSSREVSPLVLNEAMCAGLALVVSDAVPSHVDFVEPGLNGYPHPCGDVGALTRALARALADPGKLGRASRERIAAWNHAAVVAGVLEALGAYGRGSRQRRRAARGQPSTPGATGHPEERHVH